MTQYISKSALVAEIERIKKEECPTDTYEGRCKLFWFEQFLSFIDTIEAKEVNSVWHNIDEIPNFNLNGTSDLIIDSCYGHICREAHYYTPERWNTHIGFNANREFRWAYEKDLINFE